jgi:hypothetical protein
MKLLTMQDRARLLANGQLRRQAEQENPDITIDFLPVVKLFTPDAGCTWLLTELDPDDTDRAFGLCDLGLGFPEFGYVSLTELRPSADDWGSRSSVIVPRQDHLRLFGRSPRRRRHQSMRRADMNTYSVLFAEDVPHYGFAEIKAEDRQAAIQTAKVFDVGSVAHHPEWENAVCRRIITIEAPCGASPPTFLWTAAFSATAERTISVSATLLPRCWLRLGALPPSPLGRDASARH